MEQALTRPSSFWLATLPAFGQRDPLPGDRDADVAIVGGGFTGLWTAYYLSRLDPGLRIVVLESHYCGFGASGRNGGWCSGLFPVAPAKLARRHGAEPAAALYRALAETVDEVGRVAATEAVDCQFAKGGTISLARTPAQLRRARAEPETFLDATAARQICAATQVLGGSYRPDCAALHPARLVRGLAEAVERRGVTIYEGTRVQRFGPGSVVSTHGTVRAEIVVRALEGYTPALPGHRRAVAPVYSLMIATEPLPAATWERIGLARRETFSDHRHLIVYGQRTADDRLAFGGRGAPYHFGSRVRPSYDLVPEVFAALRQALREMFGIMPAIDHEWGGPLGIPRDWMPSVGLDAGFGWAGGYVGDGVAATNLAGRTLADLILGRESDRTALPWVGHHSRRWEPEPLRWLGINAVLRATRALDAWERR
jgi:glycine/D-amino acid oxidase-like deaminating enzyme